MIIISNQCAKYECPPFKMKEELVLGALRCMLSINVVGFRQF